MSSTNTFVLMVFVLAIPFLSPTSGAGSSVVSPEQSVDGFANSGAAQARQIITQHAIKSNVQNKPQLHMLYAPPVDASARTTAQLPVPQLASHGINVPTPIPHFVSQVPELGPTCAALAQQPGIVVTKRRRSDQSHQGNLVSQPVLADPAAVAAALQGRGRKKTQAQVDRRRERNRILARRTRLRKKFFFESLQKEVIDLQRENAALKEIVRSQVSDEEGQLLLEQCDATENLPQGVIEACGELSSDLDQQDFNLIKSIQQSQHSFVITDPSLADNPIVFASDDFLSLTGYLREDVLGRNCRFLQGTETSKDKINEIRKALSNGDDVSVTLVNYTSDGVPFWNKLFIAALRDAQNNIVNFIGVAVKVSTPEPGDPEYGKMISDDLEDVEFDDLQMDAEGTENVIECAIDSSMATAPRVLSG
jgi:PAS domain S-box-containing protein